MNYSAAEPFYYGRNLGCDFMEESCYTWMLERSRKGSVSLCSRFGSKYVYPTYPESLYQLYTNNGCTNIELSLGIVHIPHYLGNLFDHTVM